MKYTAVDFDGCICTNEYPQIGQPNWDIINRLKEKQEDGEGIILWTCREGNELAQAIEACHKWGLKLSFVNDNSYYLQSKFNKNPRKVVACEYWDDRAYNPITERKFNRLLNHWKQKLGGIEKYSEEYLILEQCIKELEEVLNG